MSTSIAPGDGTGKVAFVFPGQGSQSIGMMEGYSDFPVVRETFKEASDVLGEDFWAMVRDGPPDQLGRTVNTQPVMLTAGIAIYRACETVGEMKPVFMAGHSLGEYTALVASGALAFDVALRLVRFRAEVMQEAVPEGIGAMAAILGLDDEVARTLCSEATSSSKEELVEPANFNSPGQIVVAGHKNAVLCAIDLAKTKGAKRAVMLPVSVPSHCSLMRQAAGKMREKLEEISLRTPEVPLLHNADVQRHDHSESIKEILVRQLFSPVRWTEIVQSFASAGITHVVECGPGKVLSGLNKRICPNLKSLALTDSHALRHTISMLMGAHESDPVM
jgi:[acyl-carrier-protein] S-malonyltransferase